MTTKFISLHVCENGCKEKFINALKSKDISVLDVGVYSSIKYLKEQEPTYYAEWIISQANNISRDNQNVIVVFEDLPRDGIDLDSIEGYFIRICDSFANEKDENKYDLTINVFNDKILNNKIDILIK